MFAVPRAKKTPKVLTPRPVKRRDVNKFVDHCVILRAVWQHNKALFETSVLRRELLGTVAPKFFADLNLLLIEHLILQTCRLSDKEGTEKQRNLTTHFLANNADLSKTPGDKKRLAQLVRQIARFRKRILPARNKAVSHLDLHAAHRRTSLGGAPVAKWDQFWLDLEEFVAILYKRYVDPKGSFCWNGVAIISDADQLAQALRESTYFRAAIADAGITRRVSEIALAAKFHSA